MYDNILRVADEKKVRRCKKFVCVIVRYGHNDHKASWLNGRALVFETKGCGFEPGGGHTKKKQLFVYV